MRSLAMRYGHTMVVNIMDEMHSERPDSLRSEASEILSHQMITIS